MNKQSVRVGLIVLVGVVAVAIALVASKNHRKTEELSKSLTFVVTADKSGAITQTDNGIVRGYDRSGDLRWTQPQAITTTANGQKIANISNFFCAGNCPDAYGNSAAGGKNKLLKFGFGSTGAGTPLPPPLDASDIVLRGAPDANTLIIRRPRSGGAYEYVFVSTPQTSGATKDLSTPVKIGAGDTVSPLVSDDHSRVVAVENNKTSKGEVTTLRWFAHTGAEWKQVGAPISANKSGACFSGDGKYAALSGAKTSLIGFGGDTKQILPVSALLLGCVFSSDGVTFSYNNPAQKNELTGIHFDFAGKPRWKNTWVGASFNARSGSNDLFQITNREGTRLVNAKTGATVANNNGAPAAYPIGGTTFVTADAKGKPNWSDK